MTAADTRIERVETWTCRVPLARPIVMGEIRYEYRDYLVVRVSTVGGHQGIGVGMTRNAPLKELIDQELARHVLGQDALLSEAVRRSIIARSRPMGITGIFLKAISAIDIALWDIRGQAADLPVWALLGGSRRVVPASVAGVYPSPGSSLEDLQAEVRQYVAEGFPIVKIAAGELSDDTQRLEAAIDAAGGRTRIAYDAHWAWSDLWTVLPTVSGWRGLGLAWLEDPFPRSAMALAAALRDATGIPLAVGEDLDDRASYASLMSDMRPDVVRVDATANGGLTEAIAVCALADANGLVVSTHIFPEVHVHLGIAFPNVVAVEVTDPRREIDLLFRLLKSPIATHGGALSAPTAPGVGLTMDWDAVGEYAVG